MTGAVARRAVSSHLVIEMASRGCREHQSCGREGDEGRTREQGAVQLGCQQVPELDGYRGSGIARKSTNILLCSAIPGLPSGFPGSGDRPRAGQKVTKWSFWASRVKKQAYSQAGISARARNLGTP